MSETIIILSSGDESEENVKVCSELKSESKRNIEDSDGPSKKRKISPMYMGGLQRHAPKSESADSDSPTEEIHSVVFREFIDACLEIDGSSNMQKIVENKLKKYYSSLVPEYRNSEQLITLLERKRAEMQRSPSQRFMHLKEVVDELSSHRCRKESSRSKGSDRFVRKLCQAMEIIHRRIKTLEEKEVDWDDEEDSSYLQLQRYRERLIKIHKKLQELEGRPPGFHQKISFSGTLFPNVNKAIERFVNTKQEFPDYHDIYDVLKSSYERENMNISAQKLGAEAKMVFQTIGDKLQKLRKLECWESARGFLKEEDDDPAESNEELKQILNENKKKLQEQTDEVINSYAEKSTQPQSALEHSNSCESSVMKEVITVEDGVKEIEDKKEVIEEKNGEDEEVVKDSDDEEEEGEDEEDEDEEKENVPETMDDILNDIDRAELEDDKAETSENIFLYCGPVSPPTPCEGSSNSDAVSRGSNSVTELTLTESSAEEKSEKSELIFDEDTVDLILPGCSENNLEEEAKETTSNSGENEKINSQPENKVIKKEPEPSSQSRMLIKVKPLSSLLSIVPKNQPEEIQLD